MMKPYDEVVTIEIPELKLKKTVSFSVGMDLMIQSIQMKDGTKIYPAIFNPLNIYVVDKFHPHADLEKIFKDFGINTDLKISQTAYIGAPPDTTQECLLGALFTAWEGSSKFPHTSPVIFDGPLWGIRKTKDKRYILRWVGKDSNHKVFVEYPGVCLFERGTYQFKVGISPGNFDADPRNNHALTDSLIVHDFANEGESIMHTVLLPSIQFLLLSATELPMIEIGKMSKLALGAVNLGLTGKSTIDDIQHRKWGNVFIDVFSSYISTIDKAKLSSKAKKLISKNTLALYTESLVEKLVSLSSSESQTRVTPTRLNIVPLAYAADTMAVSAKKYPESDLFKLSQFTLKGAKNYYLILLQKRGMARYEMQTSAGLKLEAAPAKIYKNGKTTQRIYAGENYVVIGARKDEEILLDLSGTGQPGKLTVISPERIVCYRYPSSKWHAILQINGSGNIITKQGEKLTSASAVNISGKWSSNFGEITFKQSGNMVEGFYTHDSGRIRGTLKGNTFIGRWMEAPTYRPPHDAGDVKFVFSKDGKSFSGKWRYGFGGNSWNGNWSGKR